MNLRSPDRFELKYLVDRTQQVALMRELSNYMPFDRLGDEQGRYLITSLYYDSPDHKCYWNKLEGHRFRRKVRIRVYGAAQVTRETPCFVEIKQRINKTLQKKRVRLSYAEAEAVCGEGESVAGQSPADQAVIEELLYLQHMLQLQPSCVVAYQRLAFQGDEYDSGLRVTFDTQLKCRAHDLTLLSLGYAENQFFVPPQLGIMEVKANHRIPRWLAEMVNQHQCVLRRISKYCAALEHSKLRLVQQRVT
ncbi:MAG: polyphosphate polymerase domain-containing protein [Anaerolineae bacterium]